MKTRRVGLVAFLTTLALDQVSKLFLLFALDLPIRPPVALGPFADLVSVWNRGISYGLFQQGSEVGRWALVVLSLAATGALAVWMTRATSGLLAAALGFVAGGAAGNAIDRAAYGAVFDFVHLHVGSHSWYVFNIADAAIVAGVVGLLLDAVAPGNRTRRDPSGGRPHDRPNGPRGMHVEAE